MTAGTGGSPVLVVVSHPDDEALGFAGIIESALIQGRPVYIAIVTNGDTGTSGSATDYCGAAAGTPATTARLGLTRNGETIAGMGVLGLSRTNDPATTHVFLLGYPDHAHDDRLLVDPVHGMRRGSITPTPKTVTARTPPATATSTTSRRVRTPSSTRPTSTATSTA